MPQQPSLRERIWGKTKPLREKLSTLSEKTGHFSPLVMSVKGLGIAGEAIDTALGLPGRAATGFNKYVPKEFSEQVGQATEAVTGSKTAGNAVGLAAAIAEPFPGGAELKAGKKLFEGFSDVTTKTLDKLVGRGKVSKQFISDMLNSPDVRQAEKDVMRAALDESDDMVDVASYADKVKSNLLPLERNIPRELGYEGITLPDNLRGTVAEYNEHIYQSPISTRAGRVHFDDLPVEETANYFAHTRVENLPTERWVQGKGITELPDKTRRVIEVQSDLMQKGRLAFEGSVRHDPVSWLSPKEQDEFRFLANRISDIPRAVNKADLEKELPELEKRLDILREKAFKAQDAAEAARKAEVEKLAPYRNTWHERIIREEVKQAAVDGKTKLQFPVGRTAMQIEGLAEAPDNWYMLKENGLQHDLDGLVSKDNLAVGKTFTQGSDPFGFKWIITDVLGDGKFKAVPKQFWDTAKDKQNLIDSYHNETFDISGKVDESNPIYKFYEKDIGKFLQKNYGAKRVTDPQGVDWWEMDVKPDWKDKAVYAHGKSQLGATVGAAALGAAGAIGYSKAQEMGHWEFNNPEQQAQVISTTQAKEPAPTKKLEGTFIGTNYDPYDPDQTRPNPDGKGKAGIVMDDTMVATSLKEDGVTGNLRLGTVIRIPELGNKLFLVADTMNKRFNGMNKIDFVRANHKKTPDPEVNREFSDIEIVREGSGPEDARNFVESGEWQEMLNQQTPP